MTGQQRLVSAGQVDAGRAAELRRVKAVAAAVLVACLVVLAFAKFMEPRHAAFGFLAAFAEAAAIGGLADWYAVVALFRRPLGLPIPHTAIIPANQQRIAEKLGEFVERHFLDAAPVEAKLRSVDFASFVADWLANEKRSAELARFAVKLLPDAVDAAENSGLRGFLAQQVVGRLQALDLAPLVRGTLRSFVRNGRHRSLLDDLLLAIHNAINEPQMLAAIRAKIRDELPTILRFYRADAYVMKKVAASATAFFEDVRTHPNHPFRGEFERLVLSFVDKLEKDPLYAGKIDDLKRELLARPEIGRLVQDLWSGVRDFVQKNASGESDVLQRHLADAFAGLGRQLAGDADMRAEINQGMVVVLRSFIAEQKSGVSSFIADQVKAWDMRQLITLIETNIGKDLQYIRFNGTLIGGLAGLTLHAVEALIRAM
ncbi:DUF445 domain-containing protein [Bradyrhizobium sp. LHD-71]|uniref:DUF445 domain-containing protein n=1 Tax=Bradyrhizobium sp. LHD-71 TaxID=3072141 RepID=UPI00280E3A61|nr:DUF445 domain-containing protein [Bradyrhizobium sp. LHD-71]MDQ8728608.1 DUF445 domain-containing protein [Bradyrhizobium sp. LHD-71]